MSIEGYVQDDQEKPKIFQKYTLVFSGNSLIIINPLSYTSMMYKEHYKARNSEFLKEILRPIFGSDLNTHSDRK